MPRAALVSNTCLRILWAMAFASLGGDLYERLECIGQVCVVAHRDRADCPTFLSRPLNNSRRKERASRPLLMEGACSEQTLNAACLVHHLRMHSPWHHPLNWSVQVFQETLTVERLDYLFCYSFDLFGSGPARWAVHGWALNALQHLTDLFSGQPQYNPHTCAMIAVMMVG